MYVYDPMQKDQGEKLWSTGGGHNDGRSEAKILIMTIQVNLVPISCETGMRQHKFTLIVIIIKKFSTNLLS